MATGYREKIAKTIKMEMGREEQEYQERLARKIEEEMEEDEPEGGEDYGDEGDIAEVKEESLEEEPTIEEQTGERILDPEEFGFPEMEDIPDYPEEEPERKESKRGSKKFLVKSQEVKSQEVKSQNGVEIVNKIYPLNPETTKYPFVVMEGRKKKKVKYLNFIHYIYTKVICDPESQNAILKSENMEEVKKIYSEALPKCLEYWNPSIGHYYKVRSDDPTMLSPQDISLKPDANVLRTYRDVIYQGLKIYLRRKGAIDALLKTGNKTLIYQSKDGYLGDSFYNLYGKVLEEIRRDLQIASVEKEHLSLRWGTINAVVIEKKKQVQMIIREIVYHLSVFYQYLVFPRSKFKIKIAPSASGKNKKTYKEFMNFYNDGIISRLSQKQKDVKRQLSEKLEKVYFQPHITSEMLLWILKEIFEIQPPSNNEYYWVKSEALTGMIVKITKSNFQYMTEDAGKLIQAVVLQRLLEGKIQGGKIESKIQESKQESVGKKCVPEIKGELRRCSNQAMIHIITALMDWLEVSTITEIEVLTALKFILPYDYKSDIMDEYTTKYADLINDPEEKQSLSSLDKESDLSERLSERGLSITETASKLLTSVTKALKLTIKTDVSIREAVRSLDFEI